jgi:hypothetical protein
VKEAFVYAELGEGSEVLAVAPIQPARCILRQLYRALAALDLAPTVLSGPYPTRAMAAAGGAGRPRAEAL